MINSDRFFKVNNLIFFLVFLMLFDLPNVTIAQFDDPYAAPYDDPYAAPYDDPYAAPYDAPYAAPYDDPYAAPYDDPYNAPYNSAYGGAYRCDDTSTRDCYFEITPADYLTNQVYAASFTAVADELFGSSAEFLVQTCLTELGFSNFVFFGLGNGADCHNTVSGNIWGVPDGASWPGSNFVDLSYLSDLNNFSMHIRVNNVYSHIDVGSVSTRRVAISSFSVPPTATIGDSFSISWSVNESASTTLTSSGPVVCTPDYPNSTASCTMSGVGPASLTLSAHGPGGNGPITVTSTQSVTGTFACGNGIIDTGEQCDPTGPNMNGNTCTSNVVQNYMGGTISCNLDCTLNLSSCGRNVCVAGPACSFSAGDSTPFNQCNVVADCIAAACNSGVDVGLRLYQDGVRRVAVEPGVATSPLRVYKDGVRGVVLVDPFAANASKMLIQTSAGVQALCLLP